MQFGGNFFIHAERAFLILATVFELSELDGSSIVGMRKKKIRYSMFLLKGDWYHIIYECMGMNFMSFMGIKLEKEK